MTSRHIPKEERLERLQQCLAEDPMINDENLAHLLNVSIHTIRSDRQKLGIPEVRQRTKDMAVSLYGKAKSIDYRDIVGELLEVELDGEGLSLLDTVPEMSFKGSSLIRGHTLFAQANSLAVAIVNAEFALTGEAQIKFISPVRVGERILAKARIIKIEGRKREVEVVLKTKERTIFQGVFMIYGITREIANHLKLYQQIAGEE